jgi:hypothetical protein
MAVVIMYLQIPVTPVWRLRMGEMHHRSTHVKQIRKTVSIAPAAARTARSLRLETGNERVNSIDGCARWTAPVNVCVLIPAPADITAIIGHSIQRKLSVNCQAALDFPGVPLWAIILPSISGQRYHDENRTTPAIKANRARVSNHALYQSISTPRIPEKVPSERLDEPRKCPGPPISPCR